MLTVLATCHKDSPLALKNAEWMRDIQIGKGHEALLIINIEGRDKGMHEPILEVLRGTFDKVHFTTATEDERHWPEENRKWPWAENLTWTSAARYVRDNLRVPWLFLEADAVLLHESALNELQGAYHTAGKPFLGQLVDTKDETGKSVPPHMSGVAVYPSDVSQYHSTVLQGGGLAFDMVLKEVTTTNMEDSPLVHHCYHSPPFESLGDMRRIRTGAALYHQDKSGTLIDRLREARGLAVSASPEPIKTIPSPVSAPARTTPMTTDIFIKTYPKDYPWLWNCIRSIEKFCSGFRQVIIVSPDDGWFDPEDQTQKAIIGRIGIRGKVEPDKEPGYLWQQSVKLHADRYTDADQVLFIDSDCVFTRPITPETFVREGKIVWLKTPMGRSGGESWIEPMKAWFGATPQFEYMRRHPFLFPRWLFHEIRAFTQMMHGKNLENYILECGNFTEFNCAGILAEAKFRDRFLFLDTTKDEIPPTCVRQWHSHDGVDSAREEAEAILNPLDAGGPCTPDPQEIRFGSLPIMGIDPASTSSPAVKYPPGVMVFETPVRVAIDVLKTEAEKSGLHKARVVSQLVKAGVVEPKKKTKAKRKAVAK